MIRELDLSFEELGQISLTITNLAERARKRRIRRASSNPNVTSMAAGLVGGLGTRRRRRKTRHASVYLVLFLLVCLFFLLLMIVLFLLVLVLFVLFAALEVFTASILLESWIGVDVYRG